jgi:hypothetical protein
MLRLFFYYHVFINVIYPTLIVSTFLINRHKVSWSTFLCPNIILGLIIGLFIYDKICARQEFVKKNTLALTEEDYLKVYATDKDFQQEFYIHLKGKNLSPLWSSTRIVLHEISSFQLMENTAQIFPKVPLEFIDKHNNFLDLAKQYENLQIDLSKFITPSIHIISGTSFLDNNKDIEYICAYYFWNAVRLLKVNNIADALESYRCLGRWKLITQNRCPQKGFSNGFWLLCRITKLQSLILSYIHKIDSSYIDVRKELIKLQSESRQIFLNYKEKLKLLYITRITYNPVLIRQLFVNNCIMVNTLVIPQKKLAPFLQLSVQDLYYMKYVDYNFIMTHFLDRVPLLRMWSNVLNIKIIANIGKTDSDDLSKNTQRVSLICDVYFELCWQFYMMQDELNQLLEYLNNSSNLAF